jgi:hypothetical protein
MALLLWHVMICDNNSEDCLHDAAWLGALMQVLRLGCFGLGAGGGGVMRQEKLISLKHFTIFSVLLHHARYIKHECLPRVLWVRVGGLLWWSAGDFVCGC